MYLYFKKWVIGKNDIFLHGDTQQMRIADSGSRLCRRTHWPSWAWNVARPTSSMLLRQGLLQCCIFLLCSEPELRLKSLSLEFKMDKKIFPRSCLDILKTGGLCTHYRMEESCYSGDKGDIHTCWVRVCEGSWRLAGMTERAPAWWAAGALGSSVDLATAFEIH